MASIFGFKPLTIAEDRDFIIVKGGTFEYYFTKSNGMIRYIRVKGKDILIEPLEIFVSPSRNPFRVRFSSVYESEATCNIVKRTEEEVIIESSGYLKNEAGEVIPIKYVVKYDISPDGFVLIDVSLIGTGEVNINWLCYSKATLNNRIARYLIHANDLYSAEWLHYEVKDISNTEGDLLKGRFIPWFWIGDDEVGVEVSVCDVSSHHFGVGCNGVVSDPLGDVGAMFLVRREGNLVNWFIFGIRNLPTAIRPEWKWNNKFSISVTPSKEYSPAPLELRVFWRGPHQYNKSHVYPSEGEIERLARIGVNTLIGGVNWKSGEYIPDDPEAVKRTVELCHKYGINVYPYMTFADVEIDTDVFKEHAEEWRIEPAVSWKYRTVLMCPAASGWRKHWASCLERALREYGFDSIYLDFWNAKLCCRNRAHGCDSRYIRATYWWFREMLKSAWNMIKERNPNAIIIANTHEMPVGFLSSFIDSRLVGESKEVEQWNLLYDRLLFLSWRLGCNTLMYPSSVRKISRKTIAISLLYLAPIPLWRGRSDDEIALVSKAWNIFRFIKASKAKCIPFTVNDIVKADVDGIFVNLLISEKGLLLLIVNSNNAKAKARVKILSPEVLRIIPREKYFLYEPFDMELYLKEYWLGSELGEIPVEIDPEDFRILFIREYVQSPCLLFGLGIDEYEEEWKADEKVFKVGLKSKNLVSDVTLSIYSPEGMPISVNVKHGSLKKWYMRGSLLIIEATIRGRAEIKIRW